MNWYGVLLGNIIWNGVEYRIRCKWPTVVIQIGERTRKREKKN